MIAHRLIPSGRLCDSACPGATARRRLADNEPAASREDGSGSSDHHSGLSSAGRARRSDSLHVVPQQDQRPDDAVEREAGETSPLERGDLGLIDFENLGRHRPGEAAAFDDGADLPRRLCLRQRLRGSGVAGIRS